MILVLSERCINYIRFVNFKWINDVDFYELMIENVIIDRFLLKCCFDIYLK